MESILFGKTNQHYEKKRAFLSYQNAKTHGKHSLWRKRITLLETCILSVFENVMYKKTKIHENLFEETKQHFQKHVF